MEPKIDVRELQPDPRVRLLNETLLPHRVALTSIVITYLIEHPPARADRIGDGELHHMWEALRALPLDDRTTVEKVLNRPESAGGATQELRLITNMILQAREARAALQARLAKFDAVALAFSTAEQELEDIRQRTERDHARADALTGAA